MTISINPLFSLDFNNYLRKYRALIICIIGNDLSKMNTLFSKTIWNAINDKIDKNFSPLNRRIRDNIHYSIINTFSDEELSYLDIVYNYFINNLNLNIDDDDILMTDFLSCCKEKELTSEEIKADYEKLYLEYYYTGSIDR